MPNEIAVPRARSSTRTAVYADDSGGFFHYHGVWAPGVRLFRALGFRAKALIISAVFAMPLALVCFNYFSSQNDQIAFSAKERDGVTYVRAAMALFDATLRWRAALATGAAASEAATDVSKALVRLQEVDRKLGADLGTGRQLEAVQKAIGTVSAAGAGTSQAAAATGLIDAMHGLLGQATDGSNLALDPDLDTYYLMDGSLMNLPALIDNTDRLRLGAMAAARGATQTQDSIREMGAYESRGDLFDERLTGGLAKVAGVRPEAPARLRAEAPIKLMHAFHDMTHAAKGDATAIDAEGAKVAREMLALQGRMFDMLDELLAARVDRMRHGVIRDSVFVVITLAIAGYLFLSFRMVLQGGLDEVVRHVDAMRGGDLTTRPTARGRDEVAVLMDRLVEMQEALRAIVSQVRQSAHVLDASAQAIGHDSTELAARSEESAASLEQTAATMEEISATVINNSERSKEATRIAAVNAEAAVQGDQVMQTVTHAMENVQSSSAKIGDIIGVIDGIAFQTNILALNAAVEAARAGEQGKGFAVVASEVRALAQRSAVAAGEIKQLITTTVEQVSSAFETSAQARAAMAKVADSAQRLREILADISVGANEQSSGISQISAAIQELDRATQENARLVERAANAAATMRENSGQLAERVGQFQLD